MLKNPIKGYFKEAAAALNCDGDASANAARKVLKKSPDNPFAGYIVWNALPDEEAESRIGDVKKFIEALRGEADRILGDGAVPDEDEFDVLSLYSSMLFDYASMQYYFQEFGEALDASRELMKVDQEGMPEARLVYFSALMKLGLLDEAISAADDDYTETMMASHCRAMALITRDGVCEESLDAVLDAILHDVDLSFLLLWIINSEDEEEAGDFADVAADVSDEAICLAPLSEYWSEDERRLHVFSTLMYLFGYLVNKLDDDDVEMIESKAGEMGLACMPVLRNEREGFLKRIEDDPDGADYEAIFEEAMLLIRDLVIDGKIELLD